MVILGDEERAVYSFVDFLKEVGERRWSNGVFEATKAWVSAFVDILEKEGEVTEKEADEIRADDTFKALIDLHYKDEIDIFEYIVSDVDEISDILSEVPNEVYRVDYNEAVDMIFISKVHGILRLNDMGKEKVLEFDSPEFSALMDRDEPKRKSTRTRRR